MCLSCTDSDLCHADLMYLLQVHSLGHSDAMCWTDRAMSHAGVL